MVDVDQITLQRWVVKYITMVKANFRKKKHSFSKRVIRRRHGNTVDYERYFKIITLIHEFLLALQTQLTQLKLLRQNILNVVNVTLRKVSLVRHHIKPGTAEYW